MAEGYLNTRYGDRYDARSAGFRTSSLNPITVRVMAEIGVDTGTHYSKTYREFSDETFGYIVILTEYPYDDLELPEATTCIHRPFADPGPYYGNEEEILGRFRAVRDDLMEWIDGYFGRGDNP